MSESNVIEGRFPVRQPVIIKTDEAPRRPLPELVRYAGIAPVRKFDTNEIVQFSEALDDLAIKSRDLMMKNGRAMFGIVAQDLESLSERLVILAAELSE